MTMVTKYHGVCTWWLGSSKRLQRTGLRGWPTLLPHEAGSVAWCTLGSYRSICCIHTHHPSYRHRPLSTESAMHPCAPPLLSPQAIVSTESVTDCIHQTLTLDFPCTLHTDSFIHTHHPSSYHRPCIHRTLTLDSPCTLHTDSFVIFGIFGFASLASYFIAH